MPKSKKPCEPNPFDVLERLIEEYKEAAIADSWAGGGDPEDVEVLALTLQLASMKLTHHIAKMRRDLG